MTVNDKLMIIAGALTLLTALALWFASLLLRFNYDYKGFPFSSIHLGSFLRFVYECIAPDPAGISIGTTIADRIANSGAYVRFLHMIPTVFLVNFLGLLNVTGVP